MVGAKAKAASFCSLTKTRTTAKLMSRCSACCCWLSRGFLFVRPLNTDLWTCQALISTWFIKGWTSVVSTCNRPVSKEPILQHLVCSHFFCWIYAKEMQQFDRHKIVFLHQEGDSQSAISLKTGTSQYSVQCGPKIKAAGLKKNDIYPGNSIWKPYP